MKKYCLLILVFFSLTMVSAQTTSQMVQKRLGRTIIIGGSVMALAAVTDFRYPYYDKSKTLTKQSPRFYVFTGGVTLIATGVITTLCTKKKK